MLAYRNRNRNRNLRTSKALLKSQAQQGTSLFTSAATNQRGVSKGGSREAQVRIPEYQEGRVKSVHSFSLRNHSCNYRFLGIEVKINFVRGKSSWIKIEVGRSKPHRKM